MVASWFSQPFWSLPLPLPLPLCPPLSLPLFLPFFPPLGAKSLPFWGATVKKGVSWSRVESSPLEPLAGLCPCPWWPEKKGYLSQVPDQSRHILFFPALPSEYETLSVNNWKFLGTNMQKVIAKGLCLLETKR